MDDRLIYLVLVLAAFAWCGWRVRKAEGNPYKED